MIIKEFGENKNKDAVRESSKIIKKKKEINK